eukprot:CAMPEP_0116136138 /NCGR_PEP_ID=MMETSP0329-20121206/11561_1 /TAXON_ID=697910 /ORGANISM="Pseudo-nitzschia arenysensis, Strain B593" /LENGTH=365 /DNA_ID=CAMNT_0003630979 /DNA_START=157 /DNA_END=1250 /DNA_ORIENTATION=+
MSKLSFFSFRQRFVSIALLILGAFLLSINLNDIHTAIGYTEIPVPQTNEFDWMDTTGVTISRVVGNPSKCKDVIYTGDNRDPFGTSRSDAEEMIYKNWKSTAHIVHTSPAHRDNTCFAYFDVASPWIDSRGRELHPVWGRVPATALMMSSFPQADIFLYMDSDALIASSNDTPTAMYKDLAYDGKGEDATMQHLKPGLIVNKPYTGWLCGQCEKFGLGHGCFNSGALLWHRDKAEPVLRAWWESRNTDNTHNFFVDGDGFHGWHAEEESRRIGDKMGEQNRLMWVFGSDPKVREVVWPVPREKSDIGSTSCPSTIDLDHTPCLQNDGTHKMIWNPSGPACHVNHYADHKNIILEQAEAMFGDRRR